MLSCLQVFNVKKLNYNYLTVSYKNLEQEIILLNIIFYTLNYF